MKRITIILLTSVICMMSLSSCATMLPSRFEAFSDGVENHADNYNLRKWEKKNAKFMDLCDEYKDNFTMYSPSQRRKINSSISKYVKTAAKSGVTTATDLINDAVESVSNMLDDAKALFEELGRKKK